MCRRCMQLLDTQQQVSEHLVRSRQPSWIVSSSHKTCNWTHWDRVTQIYVGNLTIIGSNDGLCPGRHQAIIWTNAGMLFIGPLETNFSEILIKSPTSLFKKMHFKLSSANVGAILSPPQCVKQEYMPITNVPADELAYISVRWQATLWRPKVWKINIQMMWIWHCQTHSTTHCTIYDFSNIWRDFTLMNISFVVWGMTTNVLRKASKYS